ncbi:hypothetical protein [uncultured Stenotrophomonas sp.]|uniref:hypothetical protein n=1 Tax=uncultured Stenotrophomonas sp. TaxID=165438 RepID=UPI0028E6BE7D|nr:hypothetical protein [uncultured Stenotrophomonas sp.]
MNIVTKTFAGVGIEFVEFEPVTREQVSQVKRDIQRHLAAINARQAVAPAKAAAEYAKAGAA